MTATGWVSRVLSALLALALLLGSMLALVEIAAAALGRPPVLVQYPAWTKWLRTHNWNDGMVRALLGALVVLGLLLLLVVLRRGKPPSLALKNRTNGVTVTAARRSVEKSLAAAAARTTGVVNASASMSRRKARVKAQTVATSDAEVREAVKSAVRERLDSLEMKRSVRTRVVVTTKDTR